MRARPRVDVHVPSNEDVEAEWVRGVAERVLEGESYDGGGVLSIVLLGDDEIRRLNAAYLNRDRPTDVLAFPYAEDGDEVWGEVYVSVDRAREQAEDYGVTREEELARLIIHGVLHLTGYDDQDASSRERMRLRENEYLEHGS